MSTELHQDFNIREINSALQNIRKSTAPGLAKTAYGALANLGPGATTALLENYNTIWRTAEITEPRKLAKVIPLLNPGKSLLNLESFRPISLSSCVGKLLEKIIHLRLQWWLESC